MLTPQQMLATAIRIAAEAHEKQLDKGGRPYILHPLRIMLALSVYKDDELMTIGVMHDVIEDNKEWTVERLRALGFSERVISALVLMNHTKDKTLSDDLDYERYIRALASNIDAIRVKIADLEDNSNIQRLKGLTPKDFARMQRYQRAYVFLTGILENYSKIYGVSLG